MRLAFGGWEDAGEQEQGGEFPGGRGIRGGDGRWLMAEPLWEAGSLPCCLA